MELAGYLALLRKRWVTVAVATVTGVVLAGLVSLGMTPVYQATSQVFVSIRGSDTAGDLVQGNQFMVERVKSYTELVRSPRVLDPVIEELGLEESSASLAAEVSAESPLDTVLINITVSNEEPQLAARTADAIAESLATVVTDLEQSSSSPESPVAISTVRTATVPDAPSSPNIELNLVIGFFVGLAVGVAMAFLREQIDTRVRTSKDIRDVTDAPVIGTVAFDERAVDRPLIVQDDPQGPRAEAYRRLRTNLQFVALGDHRTLVVVSAIPGEGKTTTCLNLAIALADAGSRVIVVDADLRRPMVAAYLGIEETVGLTTVLIGRVALQDAIQSWGNTDLQVLPAGQVPPNPSELLGSRRMSELLDALAAEYDVVLLDTAPLLPVTDGAVLAKLAGGAVVVAGAGVVRKPQLAEALGSLATVEARVHGVIANRVAVRDDAGGYQYDYRSHESRLSARHVQVDGDRRRPAPRPPQPGNQRPDESAGVGAVGASSEG